MKVVMIVITVAWLLLSCSCIGTEYKVGDNVPTTPQIADGSISPLSNVADVFGIPRGELLSLMIAASLLFLGLIVYSMTHSMMIAGVIIAVLAAGAISLGWLSSILGIALLAPLLVLSIASMVMRG